MENEFWYNVGIYRKYEWHNNPETPFELETCSEELLQYIKNMNYIPKKMGDKWYIYPQWNSIMDRKL